MATTNYFTDVHTIRYVESCKLLLLCFFVLKFELLNNFERGNWLVNMNTQTQFALFTISFKWQITKSLDAQYDNFFNTRWWLDVFNNNTDDQLKLRKSIASTKTVDRFDKIKILKLMANRINIFWNEMSNIDASQGALNYRGRDLETTLGKINHFCAVEF